MDYYDVDDILLRETRVRVAFRHKIHNFGFLASQSTSVVPENRKVEVPYFLVEFLLRNDHCRLCDDALNDGLLNSMRAKASIVDLRAVCPHFFLLYSRIADRKMLAGFFYERMGDFCRLLLKEAFSEDDVCRLDAGERRLVVESRRQLQRFRMFFVGG